MALRFLRALLFFCFASSAFAGVQMSIDGMISKASLGLTKKNTTTGGISLSVDLGSYVRLSYEHGQAFEYEEGFMDTTPATAPSTTPRTYERYKSKVHQVSNGIDLILILYGGESVVPYIFGGIVNKQYTLTTQLGDTIKETSGSAPAPTGGAALIIRVSQKFSLKLTYKVSPSARIEDPNYPDKAEKALDEEFKVGIQYTIKQ